MIRGDNFYSINPRGRGRFDITDWKSLLGLLQTLYGSDRLRYVGRDYDGVGVAVDEPIRDVIIVEGIQLLHAEAMPLYDVAVWIDCPHDAATERAKTHNRSSGDSDYEIALWDDIWGPLDAECFREYEPMSVAAFVYRAPL